MQRACVVPVVEVPPVLLQPVERVECMLEPLQENAQADVTQVMGRQGRDEQQPGIGGRCPVGDPAVGNLLKVIRGEPVIDVADERREKVPGLAGDAPQGATFGIAQGDLDRSPRLADLKSNDR